MDIRIVTRVLAYNSDVCVHLSQPQALIEFLEVGCNPNGVNLDGYCPIHTYISRQFKRKYVDLLYTLLTNSSANVDILSFDGIPPLHMAIKASCCVWFPSCTHSVLQINQLYTQHHVPGCMHAHTLCITK